MTGPVPDTYTQAAAERAAREFHDDVVTVAQYARMAAQEGWRSMRPEEIAVVAAIDRLRKAGFE